MASKPKISNINENRTQLPVKAAKDVPAIASTPSAEKQSLIDSAASLGRDMAVVVGLGPLADSVVGVVDSVTNTVQDAAASVAAAAANASIQEPKDQNISSIFADNDVWKVQVVLDNLSPPVTPFVIPNNQLTELVFDHNIVEDAYLKGYVTLGSKQVGNVVENNELNTEFVFRGDGKDELRIEVNPSYEKSVLPEEIWFTKLDFVVYDVEDLPANVGHFKRIHFYHKPHHIMKTTNLKISSSELIDSTDKQNLSNKDRMVQTGDLIRESMIKIGLEEFIDEENWDAGSSMMFYNAPANNTALEQIHYMLQNHVSETDQTSCILYYNRGINKFQLISITNFFAKAGNTADGPGEYQLEHFFINPDDTGSEDAEQITLNRAPLIDDPATFDKDIKIRNLSVIAENSYSLFDMSGTDSMLSIISRPVHSYNKSNKRFSVNVVDNNISNTRDHFKENYTDQLFPGERGAPLFVLNNNKINHDTYHNSYYNVTNKSIEGALNYGRNFIEKSAVFLNLGINFVVPGSTHRHPGRFFGLEKRRGNTDNKYDYKLLGQWFATKTVFRYGRGEMTSYITGVKTNTLGSLKFKEDV